MQSIAKQGRVTKIGAVSATLVLSLAACAAGESHDDTGSDPVASAHSRAGLTSMAELSAQIKAKQQTASSVHMEMAYSGTGAQAAGLAGSSTAADVAISPGGTAAAMRVKVDVAGTAMDLILADSTIYIGLGDLTDGKYVSVTREEMASEAALAPMLTIMDAFDAAKITEAANKAVTSFKHTGTETVDGTEVDVYRIEVDPAKLDPASLGLPGVDTTTMSHIDEMDYTYKVAKDGLPVSVVADVTAQSDSLTMTMTFSKWGEKLDITAPPADQTLPFSDIAG